MFDSEKDSMKPSLLMLAGSQSAATHNQDQTSQTANQNIDAAEKHRRARAARNATASLPLNNSEQANKNSPLSFNDADGEQRIEPNIAEDKAGSEPLLIEPQSSRERSTSSDRDTFKPMIDPLVIFDTAWRLRRTIIAFTIAGTIAGLVIAVSTPHKYTAYSQVLVDPREVKLVERDLTPQFLGNEAALAIVDSQLQAVLSKPVLDRVIEKLNLDQDTEFNGKERSFNPMTILSKSLAAITGNSQLQTVDRVTLENLRKAVDADRAASTFVFSISAKTKSPTKSALIASAVTEAFIQNQSEKASGNARNATEALSGQLGGLKAAVDEAARRADDFAQANGLAQVKGQTVSDNELVATSAALTEAKSATILAKSRADAAKQLNVDQVVQGALPQTMVTPTLTTLREQYAKLAQNAASLEQALGPRHPRLATAIAARDSARDQINEELSRIVAGTQAELRRAIQNEQETAAALARVKADVDQNSEALITLREMQTEVETARQVYTAALLRSRETGQMENISSVNLSVISEAEAPSRPSSLSRKIILLMGTFSGFALGFGWAFLVGLRECFFPKKQSVAQTPIRPIEPKSEAASVRKQSTEKTTSNTQSKSEKDMYNGTPFYPYAPAQAQQQAQPYAQPMAQPNAYPPHYGQQNQMPAEHYAPQPYYGMQQPPMQPQMAQQQMQQPQYYPYPQPQQMMQPHYAPVQQPMMQPMQQPQWAPPLAPQYAQAPQYQAPQQPQYHHPAPAAPIREAQPVRNRADEAELDELRESLRDIRDVVENLAGLRSSNQRVG